ncbi:MAG: helix-hairpin-helix domain-containing protein, partial [Clostridiales bacterium]|nr:helix-hairpin-helix domain-containing protein [Clostridiales bacterium]
SATEDSSGKKGDKVDINSASADELASLPGIGKKTAQKIVEYRELNGRFESIEDIMKVSGIGESKFATIKDCIFTG